MTMGRYSEDPVYADLIPLPTDEGGSNPLAAIAYSEEYEETMSYLRALMAADERSTRVLPITADLIEMSPAHYTVWLYRAATIRQLYQTMLQSNPPADPSSVETPSQTETSTTLRAEAREAGQALLRGELDWLNNVALANQKNYQIWHHRTFLIDTLDTCDGEREFMERMFARDAKNYHVWSYRQWLVRRFDLWGDEYEWGFVERMLKADVRNNSVWNHRWFLVNGQPATSPSLNSTTNGDGEKDQQEREQEREQERKPKTKRRGVADDEAIRQREIIYTQSAIRRAPQNESAWNYLRGILRCAGLPLAVIRTFVEEFARLPSPQHPQHPQDQPQTLGIGSKIASRSPLADVRAQQDKQEAEAADEVDVADEGRGDEADEGRGGQREKDMILSSHALAALAEIYSRQTPPDVHRARQAWNLLATRHDPVRVNFWTHKEQTLLSSCS